MVDELADDLIAQGFSADRLHGGIAQAQRTRVMNKFKKAEFEFLVATDVAARGIDVDELELVVNYDLPYDAEDYVHRIGRTGRAGRKGMAVTFVSGRDIYKLQFIERFTRTKIRRGTIPTHGEVEERRVEGFLGKIRDVLARSPLSSSAVDRLLEEGYNSTDIAAALFEILAGPANPGQAAPGAPAAPSASPEEPAKKQAALDKRPPAPAATLPTPHLRPAARGMQWVRLNAGRETRISPRDIVGLLEDALGLPGRSVGMIEIAEGQSFGQVPQQFLDVIRDAPRIIETNSGDIEVSLLPPSEKAPYQKKPTRTGGAGKEKYQKGRKE